VRDQPWSSHLAVKLHADGKADQPRVQVPPPLPYFF